MKAMLRLTGLCVLLCLPLCDASAEGARPPAEPVALVYRLQGEAALTIPSEERRPLRLFDRLPAGTAVEVGPGSHLALAFANGRRYELGESSRALLGPADLFSRSGPVRALRPVPPLPRLLPMAEEESPGFRAGAVRIRAEQIAGLHPGQGAATLADATVLRFLPVEGGGTYRVEVHDRQGQVVFAAETASTEVEVPAGLLKPGVPYGWTVRTLERVGPVARGEEGFVTLSSDLARAREALREAVEAEEDGGSLALLDEVDRSLGLAAVERPPARFGASGAVEILHTWGEMLRRRDAGDRAEMYFRLALRLVPEGSLAAARELSALGTVTRRRGDLAGAEDLLRQAHAIHEKLAPRSRAFAMTLSELGVLRALRGEMAAAEEQFQQVLELQRQLVPDSMEMAGTLIHLGILAQDRGDFAESEDLLRRAIALVERLRPDDLELARALSCLGHTEMMQGDLALAEEHFRRALEVRQKLAPESLNVAGSLQNLGIIAEKRGELAAAEELQRRALEIRERLAPDSPYVSESLANLGGIERRRGDLAKADDYYRRALEIEEKVSPNRLATTLIRIERARSAVERRDLTLAEDLYGRALSWLEERLPGTLDVADILDGRGRIAFERGDLKSAQDLLERAVAINDTMAPGSARLGMSLNGLGQVHRRAGRLDLAADYFCRATEAFDQQRKKLGGTKEGKSAFGRTTAQFYHDCLASLIATGRPAEAFWFLERGRARAFLDLLAERDLTWSADLTPELAQEQKQIAAEYDRTQAALDHLSPVRSDAEVNRLLVQLRELRSRQEEIEAKIRRTSPRNAALIDPQPLDLAAARHVLDPGTLLLAWSVGQERSYLFAVSPETAGGPGLEVFPIPFGDQALRQRVESFRSLLQRPDSDRKALAAQARELYGLLLGPAAPRIDAAERILVSADGPLHILPFAALVRDGGFLVEQKPIHTVLSATVYAELRNARRERPPGSGLELAAFGAPSYPSLSTDGSPEVKVHPEVRAALGRGLGLSPLPATRDEVRGIAALYPEAQAFLGSEATEERAKAIGQDARYLHFACHGLLDERFPLSSALALSIPSQLREGEDNGLLQAWEIFESVRLDAELVTLSACDSALGSEMGGEGLLGLTRAFQYAGARSVLASLWGVSDVSTADLMKRFYSHLRAGQSKDEALQSAQVAAIRSAKYSHPYYWAAFQLAGDWK